MKDNDIILNENGYVLRWYQAGTDRNPTDFKDRAHGCVGDNKRVKLPYAHWTDSRFKHPQTAFGRCVHGKKGYGYDYSDRFPGWNHDLWSEAVKSAHDYLHLPECNWERDSVKYWEMVLGYFYQRVRHVVSPDMTTTALRVNVCIGHVLRGCNWSNGHDYYVFGYRVMGKDAKIVRPVT